MRKITFNRLYNVHKEKKITAMNVVNQEQEIAKTENGKANAQ